jgi:AraC-like DNA-binding protein
MGLKGTPDSLERREIDLIVIGVSNYPVRRIFISQIRAVYPDTPMLILRRVENAGSKSIGGEFILSDRGQGRDLEIVRAVRSVLPLTACGHTPRGFNYDVMSEVMRVISENFSQPDLDLEKVAKALSMSSVHLSRVLNKSVGVSFRQLLRDTRIEEAKRLLSLNRYSVKEVAALVGFADSHYFSRSFKVSTGQRASDYRSRDAIFGQ